jgi:hypothetical protein
MKPIRSVALLTGAGFLAAILGGLGGLSASGQTAAQQTRAESEKDPVLKAMLAELDRSKSQLQLPGFEKPFFLQYRIDEIDNFETKAEFGATSSSQRNHGRVAQVTVRVGDYKRQGRRRDRTGGAGRRPDRAALGAVGGNRSGLQKRTGRLCEEAGRVETGRNSAASR